MALWKIYFTGDIHGSELCFRKFLRAGEFYNVQTLVIAGDLAGKGMVPVIRTGSSYQAEFGGVPRTLQSDAERLEFESLVSNSGFYPYLTTPEEVAELRSNPQQSAMLVDRLVAERIERWISMLEDTARKKNYIFYISPGNDDPFSVDSAFKTSEVVINPEEQVVPVHEQIDMLTCGYTNITPWQTERELPEEQLYTRLAALAGGVTTPSRCIFSLHAPPYNTILDLGPRLNQDFQIQSGLGESPLEHVGSKAVRKIIEEYQPLVSVHGHIHESAGVDRIGKTRCFNPGSEYAQGVLRGVLLNIEVGKNVQLKSHLSLAG
jgi:Icc-related predicted phosphoesterase